MKISELETILKNHRKEFGDQEISVAVHARSVRNKTVTRDYRYGKIAVMQDMRKTLLCVMKLTKKELSQNASNIAIATKETRKQFD
jgi:hypothetical protein